MIYDQMAKAKAKQQVAIEVRKASSQFESGNQI